MTRENKLALVVGFGLILLVGILVSDHISTAYSREPAELTRAIDPLNANRTAPADLIAVRTATPTTGQAGIAAPATPVIDRSNSTGIEMGGTSPAVVGLDPVEAEALPYRYHLIAEGDSLSAICSREYGDPSLARELALYNGIERADHVELGARLKLPKADDLVRGRPAPMAAAPRATQPVAKPKDKTYTVKKGDMLTGIAARVLGSPSKFTDIFEANRDKLNDPDDITPGMVLRIP